jgi:hypothetical protein
MFTIRLPSSAVLMGDWSLKIKKTVPFHVPIKYAQYVRYLSLWFGEVLCIFTQEFKAQYDSQSGRSGGASAASNANIDLEL